MEKEILKEEQKTDNLDATLASPESDKVEPALDTTPIPTPEEKEEAGIEPTGPESDVPAKTDPSEIVPKENEELPPTEEVKAEAEETIISQEEPPHEELGVTAMPARTFTQEEVNDIAGKTRAETRSKTFQYIYDRYGVEDEAGLDELVGNAQRYDSLNEQYESDKKSWSDHDAVRDKELADVKEQVALMQSGIDNNRYEDAKLILRGKGLEVNLENINAELATHPEWKHEVKSEEKPFEKVEEANTSSTPNEPVTKLSVLGNEPTTSSGESEEERAMKMFRV